MQHYLLGMWLSRLLHYAVPIAKLLVSIFHHTEYNGQNSFQKPSRRISSTQ